MDFIQKYRTAFIVESIFLIILGLLAIALPFYASLSFELIIGWILALGGAVLLYKSCSTIREPGGIMSFLGAIIYLIVGILMLIYPLTGMLTLTLLLGIFFILEGIAKIVMSFELKPAQNWGWLLFNGIVALIMAGIILVGWPSTALWVLGLLIGINMVFFGSAMLAIVSKSPKNP